MLVLVSGASKNKRFDSMPLSTTDTHKVDHSREESTGCCTKLGTMKRAINIWEGFLGWGDI